MTLTEKVLNLLEVAARLINTNPGLTADKLDEVANVLHDCANAIRSSQAHGFTSPSGIGDSCRIKVAGPDGVVKSDNLTIG